MPILVDTSVWLMHFRSPVPEMLRLLRSEEVVTHSVVLGELAVGNLKQRDRTLADLRLLMDALELLPWQVLEFVESRKLFGRGLSWGDVQILAACSLSGVPLWSFDQRLDAAATELGWAWSPSA